MTAQEATLNIAVNLGRLSRFATEGKTTRVQMFLDDTQQYIDILEQEPKREKFLSTYEQFILAYHELRTMNTYDYDWADTALTWASILEHRAKLA
ncbi:hypothetical protein KBD81_05265 [Candidatus Woesebacteria bacterium]|nr:hypothetical protein [Candidatus Woesebacteria bacterium]